MLRFRSPRTGEIKTGRDNGIIRKAEKTEYDEIYGYSDVYMHRNAVDETLRSIDVFVSIGA